MKMKRWKCVFTSMWRTGCSPRVTHARRETEGRSHSATGVEIWRKIMKTTHTFMDIIPTSFSLPSLFLSLLLSSSPFPPSPARFSAPVASRSPPGLTHSALRLSCWASRERICDERNFGGIVCGKEEVYLCVFECFWRILWERSEMWGRERENERGKKEGTRQSECLWRVQSRLKYANAEWDC